MGTFVLNQPYVINFFWPSKLLLDDIIEKRKVKLYRKNFQTLENLLESWKKNLENDLPLSSTELKSFSSFRIDVLQ